MDHNKRFLLVRRPVGEPVPEDFNLVEAPIPAPPVGGIVLRNHYASLDPAQRGWMDVSNDYVEPIALGDPVRAMTIGVVYASDHPDFQPGQWVMALNALEDYSAFVPNDFSKKIDVDAVNSPSNYLSALGIVGLTGYIGLIDVANPQPGETLLVSGAAGAVGSIVGQVGKMRGCRVVGIVGGPEKCRRIIENYGYDAAIDYVGKDHDALCAAIAEALPDGANIVFENVGGAVMEAEMFNLALHARIVLCGLISEYNLKERVGIRNLWQVLVRRATIHGFVVTSYSEERLAQAGAEMAQLMAEGRLRIDEDVQEGLENAYASFMRLFSGANTGKLILKIA